MSPLVKGKNKLGKLFHSNRKKKQEKHNNIEYENKNRKT